MKKIFYLLIMISLFLIGCGQNKNESPNGNTIVIGVQTNSFLTLTNILSGNG